MWCLDGPVFSADVWVVIDVTAGANDLFLHHCPPALNHMSERAWEAVSFIFSSSCAIHRFTPCSLIPPLIPSHHPFYSASVIYFMAKLRYFWVWYHNEFDYMDYGLYLFGNSSHSAVSGQMAEGLWGRCFPA